MVVDNGLLPLLIHSQVQCIINTNVVTVNRFTIIISNGLIQLLTITKMGYLIINDTFRNYGLTINNNSELVITIVDY